jgi:hypothetical protein
MNTDPRSGGLSPFGQSPGSFARPGLCAAGLHLVPLARADFAVSSLQVTISFAWFSNVHDTTQPRRARILARHDPRASRQPSARAAKRPALTRAAGRAPAILSAPGECRKSVSHQGNTRAASLHPCAPFCSGHHGRFALAAAQQYPSRRPLMTSSRHRDPPISKAPDDAEALSFVGSFQLDSFSIFVLSPCAAIAPGRPLRR